MDVTNVVEFGKDEYETLMLCHGVALMFLSERWFVGDDKLMKFLRGFGVFTGYLLIMMALASPVIDFFVIMFTGKSIRG